MKNWLLGVLVGGILVNLLSNQIDAWLPSLARWIVRCVARHMQDPARSEEEWLAHLADTKGGLAQCFVALGILFVPLRTPFEIWRDQSSFSVAARAFNAWFPRRAALLLLTVLAALYLIRYSLEPRRYAAYWVLLVLFVMANLCLSPRCRRTVARCYDRLGYSARIATGGLALPLLASVIIAVFLIPPSRHGTERRFSDAPVASAGRNVVKIVAVDGVPGGPAAPARQAIPLVEVENPEDVSATSLIADADRGHGTGTIDRPIGTDSVSVNETAGAESREAPGESVALIAPTEQPSKLVEALMFSELPSVATPEQPIPLSLQSEITPPPQPATPVAGLAPPANVRIIAAPPSGPPPGSLGLLGVGR